MTYKPSTLIEFFKDGKKCAEEDITWYTEKELKLLLEIQETMGRSWEYKIFTKEGER